MPCNMFSEVIQQHIPSQMSKFPEVTQPGDNKMSGANCHNRLGGGGGDPGVLVHLLSGVNRRFWSHLWCLRWKVSTFAHSGIFKGWA